MRRSELLQGIREMKFISVQKRFMGGELSQVEAAELLGISDRTFRRWSERFGDEGAAGLTDRRRGNAAHNRAPEAEADSVELLYRTKYAGFTAKHFHEHLVQHYGFRWGYTWTKSLLQRRSLLPRASRRGAHRRKRPRRPLPGMMLHQDASRHQWVAGVPACDLSRDAGRCDQCHLLGDPGGGGGHRLDLRRAAGRVHDARPAVQPVPTGAATTSRR